MYKSIRFRLICLMLIIMAFAGVLMGCGKSSNYQKGQQQTAEPIETQSFTGIITRIDKKLRQISVREIDTDVDTIMNYDASSEITDKYKEEIDGDELELGQIMETTYRTDDARVVSMKVPDDAWEYSDVDKFTFDTEECSMEVAGEL